jgi:hypothetical protein
MATRARRDRVIIAAFAGWLTVTGVALAGVTEYASRPGAAAAAAPTSWPTASHLARTPGRGTLVMVAHTKCACTRASLSELARLMSHAGDRVEAIVVFVGPSQPNAVLDLRATARAIPGVRVVEDESEAHVFGAATSGQVLLYDASGTLVFRGGITSARGHEGSSVGGETVRHFATAGASSSATTTTTASEVFGCALFDNNDAGAQATGAGEEP